MVAANYWYILGENAWYIIERKMRHQALERYADRLRVVSLPTYSPKLMVIELPRKYLRRKVTRNHLFDSVNTLVEAVNAFFAGLDSHPAEVLSVTGYSELLLWIHLNQSQGETRRLPYVEHVDLTLVLV